MTSISFEKIEKKWQKRWEEKKVFQARANPKKKKFYVLEMFPYPSATGLHMGHAFNYSISDIYARYKRMTDLMFFIQLVMMLWDCLLRMQQ